MAEDVDQESKTEAPTPRRREEARRQGRVPFSAEVVGGVVLLAGVAGLANGGERIWGAMRNGFREEIPLAGRPDLAPDDARELLMRSGFRLLAAVAPLFGGMVAAGFAAGLAQAGFQVNTERFGPNFDRLNPVTGLQRLVSKAALVRGLLAILKVSALGLSAYLVVGDRAGVITSLGTADRLAGSAAAGWAVVMRLALCLTAAVAAVAVIDYLYQRYQFEASLRMTKQELKDELKQEEGDPHLKARVRQLQRERGRRRMMAEVPKAAVVLTNPTHYAVALRYDAGRDAAPVVVAKGAGVFARRIAAIARRSSVPVVERPAVARAIYAGVREGRPVPAALFRAVAEVLAFVYRMRGVGPHPPGPN